MRPPDGRRWRTSGRRFLTALVQHTLVVTVGYFILINFSAFGGRAPTIGTYVTMIVIIALLTIGRLISVAPPEPMITSRYFQTSDPFPTVQEAFEDVERKIAALLDQTRNEHPDSALTGIDYWPTHSETGHTVTAMIIQSRKR